MLVAGKSFISSRCPVLGEVVSSEPVLAEGAGMGLVQPSLGARVTPSDPTPVSGLFKVRPSTVLYLVFGVKFLTSFS